MGNHHLQFTMDIWKTLPSPQMKISMRFISAPLKNASFLNMKVSWSLERVVQFGVFRKNSTVEVHQKQEHPYTWYPMRDPIDSLQMTCKNNIFVQGDGFCNNTSSIGNYIQNVILVCSMCISRFEHTFILRIDGNSLVKCVTLLIYLNVISQPKAIQNSEILLDLIVYRDIQKR